MKLDFLNSEFCCIDEKEILRIKKEYERNNLEAIYEYQKKNLEKTSKGYRCRRCGKIFPFESWRYQGKSIDMHEINKIGYKAIKIKGFNMPTVINNRLYVDSSRGILVYDLTNLEQIELLGAYSFKRNYYKFVISQDEKLIATLTLSGKIFIYYLEDGKLVTEIKTEECPNVIWANDSKSLYYDKNGKIYQWICETRESICLWHPKNKEKDEIVSFCSCCYNSSQESIFFAGNRKNVSFMVQISSERIQERVLPIEWGIRFITYNMKQKEYLLVGLQNVYRMDETFEVCSKIEYPVIEEYNDGGGNFPVCHIKDICPDEVRISEDGKSKLFTYGTSVVLIDNGTNKSRFYFSKGMSHISVWGFYKNNYLIYSVGHTVYIQQFSREDLFKGK